MSDRINGYDFKYVAESSEANMAAVITALSSKDAITVQKEGVTCKISPHILDKITSASEEPNAKIDIGAWIEIKAVLMGSSLTDLKQALNYDSSVADVVVQSTRCFTLPQWHCQFKVRHDDGTTIGTWTASWMFVKGDLEAAFKGGEIWYLPITLVSSDKSELQISEA